MAIKKYTSGAWVSTSYRKYGTETDTITSLPAQIIGDGQPIASCQISGNTLQDGTPTPVAPVDVVGCGVKTGNLYEKGDVVVNVGDVYKAIPISLSAGKYTFSFVYESENTNGVTIIFYNGSTTVQYSTVTITDGKGTEVINTDQPITTIRLYSANGYTQSQSYSAKFSNIMLNLGSTTLPWEPYGYKIPPTVNGTEYPIYLGQVESTRKVKKLVLTGMEPNWNVASTNLWHLQISDIPAVTILDSRSLYCTHYNGVASKTTYSGLTNGNACIYNSIFIWIRDSQFASLSNFKSYLAAQYANGTPVTIWYVLAEPETGIVNEPLMKIGDYADAVAATNIPTTGTAEQFDVQTTLKPSEVQLTYHGWHEHADTKYTE